MSTFTRARIATTGGPLPSSRRLVRLISIFAMGMAAVVGMAGTNPVTLRISDAVTVWTFSPTDALLADADAAGFTQDARYLFLASRPSVRFAADLAAHCGAETDTMSLLGCFDPRDRSIHLLASPDPALSGLQAVTAAHEALHAAWFRATDGERMRLTRLLWAEWRLLSLDPAFAELMVAYPVSDRESFVNELHSVVATDAQRLVPELESYYSRYFTDRGALVRLSRDSLRAFDEASALGD